MTDLANLEVQVKSSGIEEAAKDLDKLAASADKAEKSAAAVSQAAASSSAPLKNTGAAATGAAAALNQTAAAAGNAAAALGGGGAGGGGGGAPTGGGGAAGGGGGRRGGGGGVAGAANQAAGGLANVAGAASAAGRSANVSAQQWANMSYQINDVVSGLVMGQSPFMILAQQGGQVVQLLQSQGGIIPGIKAFGSGMLSAITPVRLLVGGVLGAGAAFTAMALSARSANQETDRVISGSGKAAGATVGQINELASASSAALNITVGAAREAALAFASSGNVQAESLARNVEIAKAYGKTMGMDVASAAKELAEALRTPGESAVRMGQQFGTVSASTAALVKELEASGRGAEAAAMLMEAIGRQSAASAPKVDSLSKALSSLSSMMSQLWENTGQKALSIVAPNQEQELANITTQLENYIRALNEAKQNGLAAEDPEYAAGLQREIDALLARKAAIDANTQSEKELKAAQDEREKANRATFKGEAAVESMIPGAFQDRDLRNSIGAMQEYRKVLEASGESTKIVDQALGRATERLRQFDEAGGAVGLQIQRMGEQTRLSVADIEANTGAMDENTWAKREAAASDKAYSEALSQTGDKEVAEAAAANAASLVRAQAKAIERAAIKQNNEDTLLSIQAIQAETWAQKEAASASQAYTETLRATGSVKAASNAADNAASVVRAQMIEMERRALRDLAQDEANATQAAYAFTTAERAAAAGSAAYTAALRATQSATVAEAASRAASARVYTQVNAALVTGTRSMQAQAQVLGQYRGAVATTTTGLARLNAEMQAEIQLAQQGVNVNSEAAQTYIRMAGAVAHARAEVQALAQLRQQTASNNLEIEMYRRLSESISANSVERAGVEAAMRAEMAVRAQGISLLTAEAQAYIASARAAAEAAAAYQQASSAASSGGGGGGGGEQSSSGSSSSGSSGGGGGITITEKSNPQYQAMIDRFGEGGADFNFTKLRGAVKNATNGVGQYVEMWLEGTWTPTIEGLRHAAEKDFAAMEDDITASFTAAMSRFDASDAVTTLADKIQGYMDNAVEKPEMPTAPTMEQPSVQGDAVTDPSAFGADKNATYFYDPNSRKSFLEEFGITGAADNTQQKAYELSVQEYETAMKQYELDLKAWEEGQKHTETLQGILDRAMEMAKSGQSTNSILSMMNSNLPKSIADALEADRTLSEVLSEQQQQTQAKYDQAMKDVKAAIYSTFGLNPEGEFINPEGPSKTDMMSIMSNTHQGVGLRQTGTIYNQYNKPLTKVPGFAEGGSFTVGGEAGRDANRVMMDLTRGETVTIEKAGSTSGETINLGGIHIHGVSDAASITRSRSEIESAFTQMIRRAKERS